MSRFAPVTALAMLVGLVSYFLGVSAPSSQAQLVGQTQRLCSDRFWPPRPEEIVTITSDNLTLPMLPPGGTFSVYAVPVDRWFVMTAASTFHSIGERFTIEEDLGGTLTAKQRLLVTSNTPPAEVGGAPLGYVFAPGSQVVFHNIHTMGNSVPTFSLAGYLVEL